MVGVAADERAQPIRIGEFLCVSLQVKRDSGAPFGARYGFDREIPLRAGFPAHACVFGRARLARQHLDAIGNYEGGIEADAELADEL